jgi:hypothetical protein
VLTRRDTKAIKARHVNQVHRAKQIIAEAAAELIARQLRDAAAELRDRGVAKRGLIFDPRQWDQRLKGALAPAIGHVMLIGAASELKRHGRLKHKKSSASDYLAQLGLDLTDSDFATEMPQELVDSIEATLADSFKRDYWAHANNVTAGKIESLIRDGTTEGLSIRDMAHVIEETADGYGRQRAIVIARTESSRALNSGHVEGIEYIEDDAGIQLGKTWVSVLGSTTRPTHAAMDDTTVPTREPFYLGGHPCQFPGDADLPVEEVANCQCTITSAAGDIEEEG